MNIHHCLSKLFKREDTTKENKEDQLITKDTPPYSHCMNCGAELQGMFCHQCGQYASEPTPKVKSFVLEYLNNAFIWDIQLLPTLWKLIRRPGFLTNEFIAGRYASYVNPLKMNMFFLFVFITLFLFFSNTQKIENLFKDYTTDELVIPHLVIADLTEDEAYRIKLKESEQDTIKLLAPLSLSKDYPEIIKPVIVPTNTKNKKIDTLIVSVPKILLDNEILTGDNTTGYKFTKLTFFTNRKKEFEIANAVWVEIIHILIQYFPLIILLTSPFLSLAVQLAHWKKRKSPIFNFVFALHYTAFLEILLLLIYLLNLCTDLNKDISGGVLLLISWVYLTIAVKQVYSNNSWIGAFGKALLININYLLIGFTAITIIFALAIIIVSFQINPIL